MSRRPRLLSVLAMLVLAVTLGAVAAVQWERSNQRAEQAALNDIDVPFLRAMLVHHEQAVRMASTALRSPDPRVLQIAQSVYHSQLREQGLMQGLLLAWNRTLASEGELWDWMVFKGDEQTIEFVSRCRSGGRMPGMATDEELNALYALAPEAIGAQFAPMMMEHHQAALVMLRHAVAHAQSPLVKSLAGSMLADQRKELLMLRSALQP